MEAIRSARNPLVRRARAARRGKEPGVLVLEGERLVEEALSAGLAPRLVLVSEARAERARDLAARGVAAHVVAEGLLDPASGLVTPPGLLALFDAPARRGLEALPRASNALLVAVAGVQDPGNLGALARTAEAAGAAGLVVLPGGVRPWNEKALRGSMGSLLRLPVLEPEDAAGTARRVAAEGWRSVVARARGGAAPERVDWSGRVVLWVTAESGALPPGLAAALAGAAQVTIPLAPGVESLNVTAAAAVLLFSAGRTGAGRTGAGRAGGAA